MGRPRRRTLGQLPRRRAPLPRPWDGTGWRQWNTWRRRPERIPPPAGATGGAAPSDAKPKKPISPTRRRANSLVKSAKKLASAAVAAATGKKAAKKKRPRSGSMEGSPRAPRRPPPRHRRHHYHRRRIPTMPTGARRPDRTGRPPRPPDREAAPRGLRKLADTFQLLIGLLLAHSVDDVVEEFFVTGLDAQRDGRQAAGARLDAEALRRACQLHGGKLREAEAQAAVAALGANGAVSVSALLHFCEDRKRRLDGDTASESTVASATPPPPPLPGRHGSQGWLFDAADRAPAPALRARRRPRAAAPRRDGLRRRRLVRTDPVRGCGRSGSLSPCTRFATAMSPGRSTATGFPND